MVVFQEKCENALGFQVKIFKITAKNPRIVKAGKDLKIMKSNQHYHH